MITIFSCLLRAFNDVDKYIIMFIIIVVNHMPFFRLIKETLNESGSI